MLREAYDTITGNNHVMDKFSRIACALIIHNAVERVCCYCVLL